jgi:hypothetical protein
MSAELKKFIEERNQALATLDLRWARKNAPGASSEEVLLLSLHKARYHCKDIARELRHTSAAWLRARGYSGWHGQQLLPEGQLPE